MGVTPALGGVYFCEEEGEVGGVLAFELELVAGDAGGVPEGLFPCSIGEGVIGDALKEGFGMKKGVANEARGV